MGVGVGVVCYVLSVGVAFYRLGVGVGVGVAVLHFYTCLRGFTPPSPYDYVIISFCQQCVNIRDGCQN